MTFPLRWPLLFSIFLLALIAGCERGPNPDQQVADSLFSGAKLALARGALDEARATLSRVAAMEADLDRTSRRADILQLLGDSYALTASYDSAALYYAGAMEMYRDQGDRRSVWLITLKSAELKRQLGDDRSAHAILTEALRLAKVFKDEDAVRDIQWALVSVSRALDDRSEESRLIEDLQNAYGASRTTAKLARVQLEAGLSSYLRGEYDDAAQRFFRMATLAAQIRDTLLGATAMMRLGMCYGAQGKVAEEFQQYADAVSMLGAADARGEFKTRLYTRIGNAYLRHRQVVDARRFYRAALSVAIRDRNKVAEGYLTIQLGHCAIRESPEEAIRQYQSALSLFQSLSFTQGMVYCYASLGNALGVSGRLAAAIEQLGAGVEHQETLVAPREADDIFTECEVAWFGESRTFLYDLLLDLLLQTGKQDEAFWYAERKNRSEMLRFAGALEPNVPDKTLEAELLQLVRARGLRMGSERQQKALLVQGGRPAEALREVARALQISARQIALQQERTVRLNPAFESIIRIGGASFAELQKMVPPGAVLLHHVAGQRALYAFVVTRGRVSVPMAAVDRTRLLSTVREYMGLFLQNGAVADSTPMPPPARDPRLAELTQQLSEWFVRPIEQERRGATHILVAISPDFPWLPFHTLRTGASPMSPYVAEQQLVSYIPVISSLAVQSVAPKTVQNVLAVGFAGSRPWDVEYELRDIRAFYKEAKLVFGPQAVLEVLQQESADLLHVALPLEMNDRLPGNGIFVLSDGKSRTTSAEHLAGELFSLQPYPAIVLSDLSARGMALRAYIPALLFTNGSGSVMLSGSIPARKAKKFFGELFYTSLLAGKSIPASFRKAQIDMVRTLEYSSPYVWGGFVLWGKQGE